MDVLRPSGPSTRSGCCCCSQRPPPWLLLPRPTGTMPLGYETTRLSLSSPWLATFGLHGGRRAAERAPAHACGSGGAGCSAQPSLGGRSPARAGSIPRVWCGFSPRNGAYVTWMKVHCTLPMRARWRHPQGIARRWLVCLSRPQPPYSVGCVGAAWCYGSCQGQDQPQIERCRSRPGRNRLSCACLAGWRG